jgi:hypothetical protein
MIPLSTPLLGPPTTPPQSVELVPFTLGWVFVSFGGLSANKLFLAAKPFGMSSNNAQQYMKQNGFGSIKKYGHNSLNVSLIL